MGKDDFESSLVEAPGGRLVDRAGYENELDRRVDDAEKRGRKDKARLNEQRDYPGSAGEIAEKVLDGYINLGPLLDRRLHGVPPDAAERRQEARMEGPRRDLENDKSLRRQARHEQRAPRRYLGR